MSDFSFCLPGSFRPAEFLRSPRLRDRADDARYFVHLILTKTARRDVDEIGCVRLKTEFLRRVMGHRTASAVVDALVAGGAVERAPYRVGERSFGYRLAGRFLADRHVRVPARDAKLVDRWRAAHAAVEAERRQRMLPVHFVLESLQRSLQIDGDRAQELLAALPCESNPFDTQGILVTDIERGAFRLNVGRYGRVANNVTSLKRDLRTLLTVENEPLSHVDISCCQPALVARLAHQTQADRRQETQKGRRAEQEPAGTGALMMRALTPPESADLAVFRALTQTGKLYEHLLGELGGRGVSMTREDLKKRFLADVISKKKANANGAEYPSAVEDCFREVFPSVYRFIREVNRDGWEHSNLIRALQRAESELVIETVAADFVHRHPGVFILTLHDAIFAQARNIQAVVNAFGRAFDANRFPMTLKVAM